MITSYKDLSLKKYLELRNIDIVDNEPLDIQAEMIAILSDSDVESVLNMPLSEYQKMATQLVFLNETPEPMKKIPNEMTVNGKKYRVLKDAREMTAGAYIDYQNYIKDSDNIEHNLPLILSCFVIPKGKKYGEDYDIDDVIHDMEALPIETVMGLSAFFLSRSQTLINSTLTYLDWKVKRMEKKEKKTEIREKMMEARRKIHSLRDLVQNGDGLPS